VNRTMPIGQLLDAAFCSLAERAGNPADTLIHQRIDCLAQ